MSNRNPRERFDYQSWFDRNVAKRTEAALAERDTAFAEKHAEKPLAELARYLARKAEVLRHTPSPCEVDGGAFIEQRFGSWDAALRMACLPSPTKEMPLRKSSRFLREKKIQEPLFYEESERKKKEKRAKAAVRRAAEEARLKEKKQLEREKKEARDAIARQREAEHRAKNEEVITEANSAESTEPAAACAAVSPQSS